MLALRFTLWSNICHLLNKQEHSTSALIRNNNKNILEIAVVVELLGDESAPRSRAAQAATPPVHYGSRGYMLQRRRGKQKYINNPCRHDNVHYVYLSGAHANISIRLRMYIYTRVDQAARAATTCRLHLICA